MKTQHRQRVIGTASVVAGLVSLICCYGILADSRAAAEQAGSDLAECRKFARRIAGLQTRPARASQGDVATVQLSRTMEDAARKAQFSPENVGRIQPESARRVGETAYLEKPTQVILRQVTLRELLTFLHTVSSTPGGLSVKELRLSAPHGDDAAGRWNAEITFVYLIYQPQKPLPGDGSGK